MGTAGPNDPDSAYPAPLAVSLAASTGTSRDPLAIDASTGNPLLVFRTSETTSGGTHTTTGGDLFLTPGDVGDPYNATTSVDIWSYVTGIAAASFTSPGGSVTVLADTAKAYVSVNMTADQTQDALQINKPGAGALVKVAANGDVELGSVGAGVILKSANGSRWRLAVDNTGVVSAAAVT